MKKVKLMDIVIDPTIQVREVESYTVSKYAQAMRAGAEFPPIILEQGTNRAVCGNHRYYAYKTAFGPEYEIPVEFRTFANEAEIIRLAARDNISHGRQLDTWDQKRIVSRLLALGDTPEQLAELLSLPVRKIEEWGGMTVFVVGRKSRTRHVAPIKHGLEHMAGKTLKAEQYEEHERRDPGVPVKNMAAVITRHIVNGWIDESDERTMSNLKALQEALNVFIKGAAA